MKKWIWILFVAVICICCNKSNKTYFIAQPYIYVNDVPIMDKMPSRNIIGGENYNAIAGCVKDSICILYTPSNKKSFYSILNINTGEHMGEFCHRGNGPLESSYFDMTHKIYIHDGKMKADIHDYHKHRYLTCNISETIENEHPVYDTIKTYVPSRGFEYYPFFYVTYTDSTIFVALQPKLDNHLRFTKTPRFGLMPKNKTTLIEEYKIFNDSIADFSPVGTWDMHMPFSCKCAINEEKTKFTVGMSAMPQINIFNYKNKELKCIRIKGSPQETFRKSIIYYNSIQCDNNYIYALYVNKDNNSQFQDVLKHRCELHIFKWDGSLAKRWKMDKFYNMISLDKDKIYAFQFYSGVIDEYTL